jgi:hypothetical protein
VVALGYHKLFSHVVRFLFPLLGPEENPTGSLEQNPNKIKVREKSLGHTIFRKDFKQSKKRQDSKPLGENETLRNIKEKIRKWDHTKYWKEWNKKIGTKTNFFGRNKRKFEK